MTQHNKQTVSVPWSTGGPWSAAYDWVLEQMPCPAFRCNEVGAIVSQNASAERLWGGRVPGDAGRWNGFVALWRSDGTPVDPAMSPAALAAAGVETAPTELLAESPDGGSRHLVFHAHALIDHEGRRAGSLCAITDITERNRLESDARTAVRERSVFLSMLAHELRNPLAPILSAAGAMKAMTSDPAISYMAEVVERQTKQLARFISDLLNAARLERAEEVPVAICDTNVGEIVDRAVDVVENAIRARTQVLSIEVGDRQAPLRCDPERVAQALGNVLLNASEFSRHGAEIRLAAQVANGLFQARVTDDGEGIDPSRLEQIFEPFRWFSAALGKEKPSVGLGLSIAKSVAEAHGGVVFARSGGLGTGTTVVFALPIAS